MLRSGPALAVAFLSLPVALVSLPAAAPAQDAAAGKEVFRKCATCHQVSEGARNRTGPVLTGVVGRPAGSYEGYRYGASMTAAGEAGLVWTEERIFEYLANPSAFLRGYLDDPGARAKMTFRLTDESARRDVIAYLATFGAGGEAGNDTGDAHASRAPDAAAPADTAPDTLCVRNRNAHAHFFAVEAPGGTRRTATLAPGERLCTEARPGTTGMVSVYEEAEGFEGCSRLVPAGETEDMLKYVDFDRCFWGSNT